MGAQVVIVVVQRDTPEAADTFTLCAKRRREIEDRDLAAALGLILRIPLGAMALLVFMPGDGNLALLTNQNATAQFVLDVFMHFDDRAEQVTGRILTNLHMAATRPAW